MNDKILYNEEEMPIFVDVIDNGKLKKASLEKSIKQVPLEEEENQNYTLLLKGGVYNTRKLEEILVSLIGPGGRRKLAKPLTMTYFNAVYKCDDSVNNIQENLSKLQKVDFVEDASISTVLDNSGNDITAVIFGDKEDKLKTKIYSGKMLTINQVGSGKSEISLNLIHSCDFTNNHYEKMKDDNFWSEHPLYDLYVKISDIYVY